MNPAVIELFAYCLTATVSCYALASCHEAYQYHCIAARHAARSTR